jgi:hypothetical protein
MGASLPIASTSVWIRFNHLSAQSGYKRHSRDRLCQMVDQEGARAPTHCAIYMRRKLLSVVSNMIFARRYL